MNGNSNGSFMNIQNASPPVGQLHNQYSSPMMPPQQHPLNRNMPQALPNYGVLYPQQQRLMSVSANGNGSSQMMMNQHMNPGVSMTSGPLPLPHMARQISPNQAQQQYMQGNGLSQNQQPKFGGYSPQPEAQLEGGPHMMLQGPPMVNQYKMGPGMMQPGQLLQPILAQAQQAQAQAHFQRQNFQNAVRGPQGPQGPQSQGDGSVLQNLQAQNRPHPQSQQLQQSTAQPQAPGLANGLQGPGLAKQTHSGPHSAQHTPVQGYSGNPALAQGLTGAPSQGAQNQQNQGRSAQGLPAGQAMQKMTANQAAQNEVHAKIFRRNLGNAAVVRLIDLIELVLNEPMESLRTIEFWTRLVLAYFVSNGTIRFSTNTPARKQGNDGVPFESNSGGPRTFELDVTSAPRFFLSNVASQALASLQLFLSGTKFQVMNNGLIFIGSKVTVNYNYLDGSLGTASGFCRVLLNREFKIDWVDCRMLDYRSSIGTASLEHLWQNFSNNNNTSKMGMKDIISSLADNCQASQTLGNCGLHDRAMRTLQTGDMMSILSPLMAYLSSNNIASPLKALEEFTSNQAGLLRMGSVAGGTNGSVSSPSPRTVTQEDPKQVLKKRRFLSSLQSPMMSDGRGN